MDSYVIPKGKEFLPDVTLRKLNGLKRREREDKYKVHYTAAALRKKGATIGEIADEVDMSPGTILVWFKNMMNRGVGDGYKARQGRPPKFTQEQLEDLEADMKSPPTAYGIDSDRWTSPVVTQYVLDKFDISITHGSMRRLLVRKGIKWPGSAEAAAARRAK